MKFTNFSDLSYMAIWIYFISKKNSTQTKDFSYFTKIVVMFHYLLFAISLFPGSNLAAVFLFLILCVRITGLQTFPGCERTFLSVLVQWQPYLWKRTRIASKYFLFQNPFLFHLYLTTFIFALVKGVSVGNGVWFAQLSGGLNLFPLHWGSRPVWFSCPDLERTWIGISES